MDFLSKSKICPKLKKVKKTKILFLTVNFVGVQFKISKKWTFAQLVDQCIGIGDAYPLEIQSGTALNVPLKKLNKKMMNEVLIW